MAKMVVSAGSSWIGRGAQEAYLASKRAITASKFAAVEALVARYYLLAEGVELAVGLAAERYDALVV